MVASVTTFLLKSLMVHVIYLVCPHPRYITAGVTQHRFQEAGRFVLSCLENATVTVTIIVRDGEEVAAAGSDENTQRLAPLLYTHVALMAAAFGILFPVAAFMYYHRVALAYKIIIPFAILLALCGFVLILVYVELTTMEHFHFLVHGVLGLALLILAVLVMPLLLLHKKSRVFHFRLGHIVSFFGMGNVLLVSLARVLVG